MAASSSSSTAAQWYDVFINHRGVDVKTTFATSLYNRLRQEGLTAFLDQYEMQAGSSIPLQIKEAIKNTSIHVAIFSPRYCESYWCLEELRLMLDTKAPIVPLFYRVKHAEVRWTKGKDGIYAKALDNLAKKTTPEGTPRYDSKTIEDWRSALSLVADNSGFVLEPDSDSGQELELKLLNDLVQLLLKMLKMQKDDIYVTEYPTGLDEELEKLEKAVLLPQQQSPKKPQILGIVGLSGVGKTTLAKHFFNKKKSGYLKSCFLFEVKVNKSSLNSLQSQLLKSLTGKNEQLNSVDEGKASLIKPLQSLKALIILDDVDHVDQVTTFLPDASHYLHPESLILITSKDTGVLISAGVEISSVYTLRGLNRYNSRQLFCSHAFRSQDPLPVYEPLINKFLKACNGLALSLKVIGAYLSTLEISEWEGELGRLPTEAKERLKTSYVTLDKEEQQIFLDIACFLNGQNMDTAVSIWEGSGWNGKRGFRILKNRCLVEVDGRNVIQMHEHLRDMGREIAEESSPLRLWRWTDDVIDNLSHQQSVINVRGLKMYSSEYNKYSDDLSGLNIGTRRLQILDTEDDVLERISKRLVLTEISWLSWRRCPHSCLPSWIPLQKLRHLKVSESDLNTLWESGSESQASSHRAVFLEELIISSCVKLKSIPGLGHCTKLRVLNVRRCADLEELENMEKLTSLENFQAYGCSKLKSIRGLEQCAKLQKLNVKGCSELEALPSMETLTSLEALWAEGCVMLKTIRGLEQCAKLQTLNVSGCSELDALPSMETLTSLEGLWAEGCVKLKTIRGLEQCAKLQKLNALS